MTCYPLKPAQPVVREISAKFVMHEGKVKISAHNEEWISTRAIIFIILPAYLSANRVQLQLALLIVIRKT